MNKIFYVLISFFLLNFVGVTQAEDQRFPFSDQKQEAQFRALTEELRCLVCQNQSLADSDAPLANDLRREVYQMMNEGQTDDEIVEFLVSRYGEFVLYRPRITTTTGLLWFAPAILVLIGIIVLIMMLRKKNKNLIKTSSETDIKKVRKLLEED